MGKNMKKDNFWVDEYFTPDEKHSHRIKKYLVQKKTRFQHAILADTCSFGRCLILDGEMQSAELDEFIYHECLIHPAMILHPCPQSVLVLGGGEGATVREILKYPTIKKVVMVDIDGEVVEFCEKYLSKWHQGIFSNPKVELIVDDAKKYVEQTDNKFDLIISDLPTPIEAGPAYTLYTKEFYKVLKSRLNPEGIFNLQAGSGNLLQFKFHSRLYNTLNQIFPQVNAYYQFVPSFDVPWAFLTCFKKKGENVFSYNENDIDRKIKNKLQGKLKFYDGKTHWGLFRIPKFYQELLDNEKHIISAKTPCFFYK